MKVNWGGKTLFEFGGSRALAKTDSSRYALDQYITDFLIPAMGQFSYNGNLYPYGGLTQTLAGRKSSEISHTLPGYVQAAMRCPPVFAAEMKRALVLSQARFTFRNRSSYLEVRGSSSAVAGRPSSGRRTFGTTALSVLERPWPNATTGQLLTAMEWHAGLGGNAFVTNWQPGRLRVLRPDWTVIVYGSELEPDDAGTALDGQIIGYAYQNGGFTNGNPNPVRTLRPEEVAHWAPIQDPLSPELGMSWLTPGIRDVQGDQAMTEHKLRFFENGATPNMVVKGLSAPTKEKFNELIDQLEGGHTGIRNAYRTFYLTAGLDIQVVGADLQQLAFTETQGKGETRLAMLSQVPAAILQISEGLQGSAMNASQFGQSRRMWADSWVYPTLQDAARALAPLVQVPAGAELWFDVTDMPMLREDAKDAAEIEQIKAATIGGLVKDGFTPESSVAAVMAQNMDLLKPIPGWISVQMQPQVGATAPVAADAPPLNGNGKPESQKMPEGMMKNG